MHHSIKLHKRSKTVVVIIGQTAYETMQSNPSLTALIFTMYKHEQVILKPLTVRLLLIWFSPNYGRPELLKLAGTSRLHQMEIGLKRTQTLGGGTVVLSLRAWLKHSIKKLKSLFIFKKRWLFHYILYLYWSYIYTIPIWPAKWLSMCPKGGA